MDLNEIRKAINEIDENMKILFDKRFICSKEVALTKLSTNDQVFKPLREKEICERYSDENSKWYLPFVKKVMQISRKYQYSLFEEQNKAKEDFLSKVSEEDLLIYNNGGTLRLKLNCDASCEMGLDVKGILSLIGDTSLQVTEVVAKENIVEVNLVVESDNESKKEALILSYMLYMETVH
ncbi:MAG: hypothetical protein E7258_00820 [Lachnospiraceae bacterium]|nr:hypothetical protein [Lachnospiraceae bacterium]